jgi:hypothetical protein
MGKFFHVLNKLSSTRLRHGGERRYSSVSFHRGTTWRRLVSFTPGRPVPSFPLDRRLSGPQRALRSAILGLSLEIVAWKAETLIEYKIQGHSYRLALHATVHCLCYVEESRPSLWSSGQSSWLQIRRCIVLPGRYELNLYLLCWRK